MEKIDPLFKKKTRISGPKTDSFFKNRGHAYFKKTDPFSVKFRTMMRTLKQREWRDRARIQRNTDPRISSSFGFMVEIKNHL